MQRALRRCAMFFFAASNVLAQPKRCPVMEPRQPWQFFASRCRLIIVACFSLVAWGQSFGGAGDYKVTATGIAVATAGAYRWCDSDRLLLGSLRDAKGNTLREAVFLDVRTMQQIPAGLTDERGHQLNVDLRVCDENQIVAWLPRSAKESADLDHVFIGPAGKSGRLLASVKNGGTVSLKGKYVVANTPKILAGDSYRVDPECATYHDPNYKVLCWDTWLRAVWPLSRYVIAEYTWQDYVSVEVGNGKRKQVKNQESPLFVKDGKPVYSSFLLRDFNSKVLANLSEDEKVKVDGLFFVVSPDEKYVYSPCKLPDGFDLGFDAVCRYSLDGNAHRWDLIFHFEPAKKEKTGIAHLDVGMNGDVYFSFSSRSVERRGIWKYESDTKAVKKITRVAYIYERDERPKVSPDGKRIAFTRPQQGLKLFILEQPGAR